MLIRLFGDIPFATGASDSNLENVYVGKTDRDVIMEGHSFLSKWH